MTAPGPAIVKAQVWFPDTSALVTLACHPPLGNDVRALLSTKHRVLLAAVVGELEGLVHAGGLEGNWARTALTQLGWLGEPMLLDEAGQLLALEIQEEVAGGRPLRYPEEHWGEAAVLGLASRAQTLTPIFLSDDYNARVAAQDRHVKPYSVLKLLHLMVSRELMSAATAEQYSRALHQAGRTPVLYTAAEFTSGDLGRVAKP